MSLPTFGIAHHGEERSYGLTEQESALVGTVIETIRASDLIHDPIDITSKSSNYKSIVIRGKVCDFDLMRFKFTDKTAWVAVPLSNADNKEYRDDPRFAAQKNKNQFVWKAKIGFPEDVSQFIPFAIRAFLEYAEKVEGFTS